MKKKVLNESYPQAKELLDKLNFVKLKGIRSADPLSDRINPQLLLDLENASKNAGVRPTITTAISGHGKLTHNGGVSRHSVGEAVDIAIINGNSVDSSQSSIDSVWKLVKELVNQGYYCSNYPKSCSVESGHPKAILWLTDGHFNHIHISNNIDYIEDVTVRPEPIEPEIDKDEEPDVEKPSEDEIDMDVEERAKNIDKILTAIGLEKISKMDANFDGEDLAHELAKLFGDDNVEVDDEEEVTVFGQKWRDLYSNIKSSLIEQKIHEELNRFKQLIK